jgi:hypothetical protein
VTRRCECCGQPLTIRLGVRLTPLKADLFDLVEKSGSAGISAEALAQRVLAPHQRSRNTVNQHIYQINDLLGETDFELRAGQGGNRCYRLKRVRSSA